MSFLSKSNVTKLSIMNKKILLNFILKSNSNVRQEAIGISATTNNWRGLSCPISIVYVRTVRPFFDFGKYIQFLPGWACQECIIHFALPIKHINQAFSSMYMSWKYFLNSFSTIWSLQYFNCLTYVRREK